MLKWVYCLLLSYKCYQRPFKNLLMLRSTISQDDSCKLFEGAPFLQVQKLFFADKIVGPLTVRRPWSSVRLSSTWMNHKAQHAWKHSFVLLRDPVKCEASLRELSAYSSQCLSTDTSTRLPIYVHLFAIEGGQSSKLFGRRSKTRHSPRSWCREIGRCA